MKPLLFLFLILFSICTLGQNRKRALNDDSVRIETDRIYDKLVRIRRDFHTTPELAGTEKRSQEVVKQYLLDLGIEVEPGIYGHGVVGILKGGKPGKKIAWRSDMDALPTDFPDGVDYQSKVKGVQHGCGHDVHMAIGLGIAEVLSSHKESLHGTVYFIFQPEEETFLGAKGTIDHGLFSRIYPDEIYGLHVTALPTGKIMVKPNEMFAYQTRIRIKLKDDLSKEEAQALAAQVRSSLSRSAAAAKPWEIQLISDVNAGLSNPNTIFRDYSIVDEHFVIYSKQENLFLEVYVYETNERKLKSIIPKIKALFAKGKYKDKLLSVTFIQENPTVVNDEKLSKQAIKILKAVYGEGLVAPDYGQVPYFNDDFAYFQQKIPGVYFFLGGSNVEKGIVAMNHAPNFNVDEECIRIAVRSFSSLLMERSK